MRLLLIFGLLTMFCIAFAACSPGPKVSVFSSPFADGLEHTEPVFFTGRHYLLKFKFIQSSTSYRATVLQQEGVLGKGAADQRIAEQVAASALAHFACQSNQRAEIVPATAQHNGTAWDLELRCVG